MIQEASPTTSPLATDFSVTRHRRFSFLVLNPERVKLGIVTCFFLKPVHLFPFLLFMTS